MHQGLSILLIALIGTVLLSIHTVREYIGLWDISHDSVIALETDATRYNQALRHARAGEYEYSRAILEQLVRDDVSVGYLDHDAIYELYGDILYLLSGSTNDIVKLYTLIDTSVRSDRVDKKIALLTSPVISNENGKDSDTAPLGDTLSGSELSSGEILDIEQKYGEILTDQGISQKFMYPVNGIPRSESEQISDIRKFLDEDIEVIDW